MLRTAKGTFTVQMQPTGESDTRTGVATGRMSLAKQFEGDWIATGQGEMLTALTPEHGSAGYVAIERVTGTLHGMSGSLVLQHSGIMDMGAQQLAIQIVPGSGTDQLAGIRGHFTLTVEQGRHSYELAYALPAGGASAASA